MAALGSGDGASTAACPGARADADAEAVGSLGEGGATSVLGGGGAGASARGRDDADASEAGGRVRRRGAIFFVLCNGGATAACPAGAGGGPDDDAAEAVRALLPLGMSNQPVSWAVAAAAAAIGRFFLSLSVTDLRCNNTEEARSSCGEGVVFSVLRCRSPDAGRFLEENPGSSLFCSAKERPVFLPLASCRPISLSRSLSLGFFEAGCRAFLVFAGAVGLLPAAEPVARGFAAAAREARNISITLSPSAGKVVL